MGSKLLGNPIFCFQCYLWLYWMYMCFRKVHLSKGSKTLMKRDWEGWKQSCYFNNENGKNLCCYIINTNKWKMIKSSIFVTAHLDLGFFWKLYGQQHTLVLGLIHWFRSYLKNGWCLRVVHQHGQYGFDWIVMIKAIKKEFFFLILIPNNRSWSSRTVIFPHGDSGCFSHVNYPRIK